MERKDLAKVDQRIAELARREGITPDGITILGGNPYINVTGLDCKMKNKARDEGLVLKAVFVEPIGGLDEGLFGYEATVEFFDRDGFMKALELLKTGVAEGDEKRLQILVEAFTYRFSDEGFASPDTCEAIALEYRGTGEYYTGKNGKRREKKVPTGKVFWDNVRMMASRRATNRAKREATGTGLTSLEEVPASREEPTHEEPPKTPPQPADPDYSEAQFWADWEGLSWDGKLQHVGNVLGQKLDYPLPRALKHWGAKDITELTSGQLTSLMKSLRRWEGGKEPEPETAVQQGEPPPEPVEPAEEALEKAPEAEEETPPPEPTITERQLNLLFAKQKDAGVSEKAVKLWLSANLGISSRKDIPASRFQEVLDWFESFRPDASEPELPDWVKED